MYTPDDAARDAGSAEGEALWRAIKTQYPQALANATYNRKLNEDMAVFVARSRSTPPEALGFLAGDVRFKKNYKLVLALCRNPKTPQRVVLTLLKHVKIFDLADLSRNRFVPSVTRQKVYVMLVDRIKGMPSGVKIALSKRASTEIVLKLMEKSGRRVGDACLESPLLTEPWLVVMVQKEITKPEVVRALAEHPKWSLRYAMRYALIRNRHTPLEAIAPFLAGMKVRDLKDLYADTKVSPSTKPFIHQELLRRGEDTEPIVDEVVELDEHEDHAFGHADVSELIEDGSRFVERAEEESAMSESAEKSDSPYEPDEPEDTEAKEAEEEG